MEMKNSFEKELKQKLSQRVKFNYTEMNVLREAFKFYDLANSGICNRSQWIKAIGKIGLSGFSERDLSILFDIYDTQAKGSFQYREFISDLFTYKPKIQVGPKISIPIKQNYEEPKVEDIISQIRIKLVTRGIKGIISLRRGFKIMDNRNIGLIDSSDFKRGLADQGFILTSREIGLIFKYFDKESSGFINYEDFVKKIRGNMNDYRRSLVNQVFLSLDLNGSGLIDIEDIRRAYTTKGHPDVLAFKKTSEEVLLEFLQTFDIHHSIIKRFNSSKVTKEDFLEYYENLSMSIEDDGYFAAMMHNCYKIPIISTDTNNTNFPKPENSYNDSRKTPNPNIQNTYKTYSVDGNFNKIDYNQVQTQQNISIDCLLDLIRQALINKRSINSFLNLDYEFKLLDNSQKNGKFNLEEFSMILANSNLNNFNLSKNEVQAIFDYYDTNRNGTIYYEDFLKSLRGSMNERRKNSLLAIFVKLDSNQDGIVSYNDIKSAYNCKYNPEVTNGSKSEIDVLKEFLTYFDCINSKHKLDCQIELNDFLSYYENISAAVDNDDYFDLIINNSWKFSDSKTRQIETQRHNQVKNSNNAPISSNIQSHSGNISSNTQSIYYQASINAVKRFREKLAARGIKGILTLSRMFRIFDSENSGYINLSDFFNILNDYRMSMSEQEVKNIFSVFDFNGSSKLFYDDFLRGIVGEMNDARRNIVKRVFTKLDRTQNGTVSTREIKANYNASRHPEVVSGKRTEDDVIAEWIDNFDQYTFLRGKTKWDECITQNEFIEYYNNISMSIDDDRYFELIMNNCWNLDNRRNYSNYGQNNRIN